MILEAIGDCAGMCAVIDLKAVADAVSIQPLMQALGIGAQAVLVSYVE